MTYNSKKNTAYIKANVPKDRLEQYTKDIKSDAIRDFAEWLENNEFIKDYNWTLEEYEVISADIITKMYEDDQ